MQVVITTTNNTFHFLTGTPNYSEEQTICVQEGLQNINKMNCHRP